MFSACVIKNGQIQNCYNSRSQSCNCYFLSIVLNLSLVIFIDFMTLCGKVNTVSFFLVL